MISAPAQLTEGSLAPWRHAKMSGRTRFGGRSMEV